MDRGHRARHGGQRRCPRTGRRRWSPSPPAARCSSAAIFGYGLWRTRPRSDPELDLLMDELAIEPRTSGGTAVEIDAMRRMARVYLALGAVITALGLFGGPRGGARVRQRRGDDRGDHRHHRRVGVGDPVRPRPRPGRLGRDARTARPRTARRGDHGRAPRAPGHGAIHGRESVTTVGEVELRSPSDEPAGWLRDLAEAERLAGG